MQIEKDRAQREADIKICQAEVQNLQKELDAITATLTQLENQKKEAQKRLDELDDKVQYGVLIHDCLPSSYSPALGFRRSLNLDVYSWLFTFKLFCSPPF